MFILQVATQCRKEAGARAAAVVGAVGAGGRQQFGVLTGKVTNNRIYCLYTKPILKTFHTSGRKFPELLADEGKNLSTGVHRPEDAVSVGLQ